MSYWNGNFPMNPFFPSFGWWVCHNFPKTWKDTIPCSYRSTYLVREGNGNFGERDERYRVFIKYSAFPYFVIFLNSASSAAALVFYLPVVRRHTDTERKKQRKARVRNSFKFSEKYTIFNEHPVLHW